MKRWIGAALGALTTFGVIPAQATPFDGAWYMACPKDVPGGEVMPVTIEGRQVLGYESECSIESIAAVGDRKELWKARLSCAGEGETWTDDRLYGLSKGDGNIPTMLVEIDTKIGSVLVYKACD